MSSAFRVSMAAILLFLMACAPAANAAVMTRQSHKRLRAHHRSGSTAHDTAASTRHSKAESEKGEFDYDTDDDYNTYYGDELDDSNTVPEELMDQKGDEDIEKQLDGHPMDEKAAHSLAAHPMLHYEHGEDHEEELAKLQLAVTASKNLLNRTLQQISLLTSKKAHYENKAESDKEIDSSVRLVINETESTAMAGMLGNMWKEMRMYETPQYIDNVEDEIAQLQVTAARQQQELAKMEANLAAEQNNSAADAMDAATETAEPTAAPAATAAPATAATPATPVSSQFVPWWMRHKQSAILGAIIYIGGGFLFAYIYKRYREDMKVQTKPNLGTWSTSPWQCCLSTKLCLTGFCCPCIRWADTVDAAQLLSYWPAFMIMFLLIFLDAHSYGTAGFIVVIVGVFFRQKLRAKYGLQPGKPMSYLEDIGMWCFCMPCAIIQEAHETAAH